MGHAMILAGCSRSAARCRRLIIENEQRDRNLAKLSMIDAALNHEDSPQRFAKCFRLFPCHVGGLEDARVQLSICVSNFMSLSLSLEFLFGFTRGYVCPPRLCKTVAFTGALAGLQRLWLRVQLHALKPRPPACTQEGSSRKHS